MKGIAATYEKNTEIQLRNQYLFLNCLAKFNKTDWKY